ncbi:MAG: YncE family protein [Desulfuromonadales bacterium]|nr:YncE family protein [Desulfuromonadales bacterium]MBN2790949.1 YncE family protein [Desulfuromonadales bacterium]
MKIRDTKTYLYALLLVTLLLLNSCSAVVAPQEVVWDKQSGSFSLFLQPLPQEADRLSFTLADLVARNTDGSEIPLLLAETKLAAEELIGKQKRLLSLTLPPGQYLGIAMRIAAADLRGEEGPVALLPPAERLLINFSFTIREEQAETLLLSLSADRLVTDGALFTPKFSLWKAERVLTNLKGFVANRGAQSLTVFNKRDSQVLSQLRIGKKPTALALDQQRNWLYVALAGEHAIAVVEVANNTILGRVPLRFGDQPSDLELSRDGRTLVCLNNGSESLSIIDTNSLFEIGRVRLPSAANDLFLDRDSLRAYVLQSATSTLSIIDLQQRRLLGNLALEEAPLAGVASNDGRFFYLINDFSSELTVLDAASLSTAGKIFVGNGAQTIKTDPVTGLLYVGKQDAEIAVVDPRALMAIDSYALPAAAADMTIDNEENALFVVLPQLASLLKLDLISKKELGRVTLEAAGQAVVVMGER